MSKRASRAGATVQRRKNRSRSTPKWLLTAESLDAIAKARCLMVLRVLSGEQPVTEAIVEAKISRGTYYQLETRALNAMLSALNPLSSPDGTPDLTSPARRITELEAKVKRLEQDKRRAERLLFMTRKVIRPVPVTTGRGPKTRKRRSSTTSGSKPLAISIRATTTSDASTPTTDGADEP